MNDLIDKFAVEETLRRYMIAVDRADGVALRAVFTDDGQLRSANHSFPADEYVIFVINFKKALHCSLHQLSNAIVTIDGDEATSISYFNAVHVAKADCPNVVFGELDRVTDVVMAGTYEDRLRRTFEGWKIVDRFSTILYQSWTPSTDPAFKDAGTSIR